MKESNPLVEEIKFKSVKIDEPLYTLNLGQYGNSWSYDDVGRRI